jgi:diadenosine tetraphosphatase ApaH/serine/threonine PP2A family protein phosphatase
LIAIISDIHGNLEALEAVLEDADRQGATETVCLGDVVGYGADPNRCMELVRAKTRFSVLGNHDVAAIDLSVAENFNDVAREAIRWTHDTLTAENLDVLKRQSYEKIEGEVRYVHASPDDPPAWHYILTEQEAWNAFEACAEPVCFVGHSHVPLRVFLRNGRLEVLEDLVVEVVGEDRALLNVGSVGQPRDGDWRASYGLWNPEAKRLIARRVEYDLETASRKIVEAGLPEVLARRLAYGQ